MRTFTIAAAGLAAILSIAAAPADSGFCYDLDVNVNGEPVVDEADCIDAPAAPELPELP